MALKKLIEKTSLTRELTHDLSGVGYFISDSLNGINLPDLFDEELKDFKKASSKLKLYTFPVLYNDFEALFRSNNEKQLNDIRKKFRITFPYLSSLEEISVFFLQPDRQPCAISCFFMSEVLTRIFDVQGRSPKLLERYEVVLQSYEACKLTQSNPERGQAQVEISTMPIELFDILSPNLGATSVLNLYQRIFDKLRSKYSSLPSFQFLQTSIESLFSAH